MPKKSLVRSLQSTQPLIEKQALALPSFIAALKGNPEAVRDLPMQTFWRYANGDLPQIIHWLIKYPDLLVGMAIDAQMRAGLAPDSIAAILNDAAKPRDPPLDPGH